MTKTAVITGANSGLGLECARSLLRRSNEWHVVLAVRDPDSGAAAVQKLPAPQRCSVLPLDLASLASVSAFVARIPQLSIPPLRALVCNAGVQVPTGLHTTADGVELTFGVNHLGHFALTTALLDLLTPLARIVVVTSDTHDPRRRTGMPHPAYTTAQLLAYPDDDNASAATGRRRYTTSKLCNLLFVYELDRRLGQGSRGITVNAFNPGLMPGSGLARDYPPLQKFAWNYLLPALRFLPQVRSVRTSGAHLAALTEAPRFEGITGEYFDGLKAVASSHDSYDRAKAQDLWSTSERLVNVLTEDSALS